MSEHPLFALILLTVLFLALPVYSEINKWIDDKGQIHYTQTPPTKGKSEVIVPPPAPAVTQPPNEALKPAPKDPKVRQQDLEIPKHQQKTNKEMNRIRKENCATATKNLNTLQSHGRIKFRDGENYRILSAEEHETKINEVRKLIEQNCN